MPSLYDGSQTWGQILASLPATFEELIESDFVVGYLEGGTHPTAGGPAILGMLEWFASFETRVR